MSALSLASVFGQPSAWVDGRWFYPASAPRVITRKPRRLAA